MQKLQSYVKIIVIMKWHVLSEFYYTNYKLEPKAIVKNESTNVSFTMSPNVINLLFGLKLS